MDIERLREIEKIVLDENDPLWIETSEEIKAITDLLECAKPFKLEVDAIWSAMLLLKNGSVNTIQEACRLAIYEWDL